MSSIKLTADSGGGTFEIKAPASSGNTRVLTLPDTADATLLTSLSSVGKVVDQKFALSTTNEQNTSANTTWTLVGPQITHTAASTSNKLVFLHSHHLMIEGAMFWHMGFYRDGLSGTQVAQIKTYTQLASNWSACTGITNFTTTAPDTNSHTYQFAIYRNGGSDSLIRYSPNSESFGSQIMMFEVEP